MKELFLSRILYVNLHGQTDLRALMPLQMDLR